MALTKTAAPDGHQDIDRIVRRLQTTPDSRLSANLVSHAHAYTQAAASVTRDLKREGRSAAGMDALIGAWVAYAKQFEHDAIKARDTGSEQPHAAVLLRDWEALDRAALELWTDLQSRCDQVRVRVHAGKFARERQQSLRQALNARSYDGAVGHHPKPKFA